MKLSWLWSEVYKGLEIAWRVDTERQGSLFLGWHSRYWKQRGW